MAKLPSVPTSWHPVEICANCDRVLTYTCKNDQGETLYGTSRNYTEGFCRHCGTTETKADIAAWYDTGVWYKPWTWRVWYKPWTCYNSGCWELKAERQARLEAEKLFDPIRKKANDD